MVAGTRGPTNRGVGRKGVIRAESWALARGLCLEIVGEDEIEIWKSRQQCSSSPFLFSPDDYLDYCISLNPSCPAGRMGAGARGDDEFVKSLVLTVNVS